MKSKKIFIAFAVAIFSLGVSHAQSATPKVKKHQATQQKRIHQGVATGELTKAEVKSLQKQQKSIQKHKATAKADGVVTKKEKASLHAHQSKASKNIYRKKHNQRDRN